MFFPRLILPLCFGLSAQAALAHDWPEVKYDESKYETVELKYNDADPLVLHGDKLTLVDVSDSGAIHRIAGIFFRGEAVGVEATVEATINQKVLGKYPFPLKDPPYWIRDFKPVATNKVGFRVKSGKTVKISQVVVIRSVDRFFDEDVEPSNDARTSVSNENEMDECLNRESRYTCAMKTIRALNHHIDELDGLIERDEFDEYFPAILAANTDLDAAIEGNQVDSQRTIDKIAELLVQIKAAETYLLKVAGGQKKLRVHARGILASYYGAYTLKLRIEVAIH